MRGVRGHRMKNAAGQACPSLCLVVRSLITKALLRCAIRDCNQIVTKMASRPAASSRAAGMFVRTYHKKLSSSGTLGMALRSVLRRK
jgi:hypothetical protein